MIKAQRIDEINRFLDVVGRKETTMFRYAAAIFFTHNGYSKIELEKVFDLHHQFVTRAQGLVKAQYNKDMKFTSKFDKEMALFLAKEHLLME